MNAKQINNIMIRPSATTHEPLVVVWSKTVIFWRVFIESHRRRKKIIKGSPTLSSREPSQPQRALEPAPTLSLSSTTTKRSYKLQPLLLEYLPTSNLRSSPPALSSSSSFELCQKIRMMMEGSDQDDTSPLATSAANGELFSRLC